MACSSIPNGVVGEGIKSGQHEIMKSGQFMVSSLEEDVFSRRDDLEFPGPPPGPNEIDNSLRRLFACMNQAYKNGVTTPRWKKFNGMNIRLKDRIRLNNAIWRCWHIECLNVGKRSKRKLIQFVTPLDSDFADKEVTLLEGNYWRQRHQEVIAEYIKWRKYYWSDEQVKRRKNQNNLNQHQAALNIHHTIQPTHENAMVIDDGFFSDICDTLYSHAMPEEIYDMADFGFNTAGINFPEDYSFDSINPSIPTEYVETPKSENDALVETYHYQDDCDIGEEVFKPPACLPAKRERIIETICQQQNLTQIAESSSSQPSNMPSIGAHSDQPSVNIAQSYEPSQSIIPSQPIADPPVTPVPDIDGMGLDIDQAAQLTLPNGKQVVLIQALEDGSYVQIRGTNAQNVIFTSSAEHQIKSASPSYAPKPSMRLLPSTSSFSKRKRPAEPSYNQTSDSLQIEKSECFDQYGPSKPGDHDRTAEHKRRHTMKMAFDHLEALLAERNDNSLSTTKMSKACILNKARDHINKKHLDKKRIQQEIALLRRECENLQQQIATSQDQMPETGIPLSKARCDKIHKEFLSYICQRTEQNYKFWPFSQVTKILFESYTTVVSASDMNRLHTTASQWVQSHCNLPSVRPAVSNALRFLSTDTCILNDTNDGQFPEQCVQLARSQVIHRDGQQ